MTSEAGERHGDPKEIRTAAVIGAGTMGRQIAALIAASGRPVRLWDADPAMLAAARERIAEETSTLPDLPRYAHHQFTIRPSADVDANLERITAAESLASAVSGADIVIEAVREDLETKKTLFTEMSRLAPDAILTTNSSSLPSSQIASAVDGPGRFLNTHFFAPVWSRPMVELMGSGSTRPEVMDAVARFGRSLGLVVAVVRGDSKGFIINRVWRAVKRESLRVVDEGHADPADIDRLWMLFFGTPYGPFGIMDMVGLDVVSDIETSYQNVATDPEDRPSAVLKQKLSSGDLGEKTGRGFYSHPDPEYLREGWLDGDEVEELPEE
jgi:3-hydroxybutyryl-CoA dehydrogenase